MTQKYYYITFVLLFSINLSFSQNAYFIKAGNIQYDKTIYIKNIIKRKFLENADPNSRPHFEKLQQTMPENVVIKKELNFNSLETIFANSKNNSTDPKTKELLFGTFTDNDAISYFNFQTQEYRRLNDVLGEKSLIKQEGDHIVWKITDEYREIAGYNCRRANGIVKDSIYVIGFYTTEIPIAGGPESIKGLPGMILGLVIPDLHVSYFATEVKGLTKFDVDKSSVFTKHKIITENELKEQFNNTLKTVLSKELINYIIQVAIL